MRAARRSAAGMRARGSSRLSSPAEVGRSSQSDQYARGSRARAPASPSYARIMRLGVLDVGSNTVHLLVVDAHPGARPIPTASHKSVLRLMRYLEADGSISEVGVEAILDAVREAAKVARELGHRRAARVRDLGDPRGRQRPEVLARIDREIAGDPPGGALRRRRGRASPSSRCAAGTAGRPAACCSSTSAAARSRSRTAATRCRMSRAPSPSAPGRSTIEFLPDDPPSPEQVARLRAHARRARRGVSASSAHPSVPTTSSARRRPSARSPGSPAGPEEGVGAEERIVLALAASTTGSRGSRASPPMLGPHCPASPPTARSRSSPAPSCSPRRCGPSAKELEVSPWALREGLILRRLDRTD